MLERAIIGAIVICLCAICFLIADSTAIETREASAVVEAKSYRPGYHQPQTVMVGKTPVTNLIWIPPAWEVTASGHDCEVTKEVHDRAEAGREAKVLLASGRFTGSTYCKGLYLL